MSPFARCPRAGWRVLRAGTVWLGTDVFEPATEGARLVVGREPALGAWAWSCDTIDAVPGELALLSGDEGDRYVRLGEVVYTLDGANLTASAIEAA